LRFEQVLELLDAAVAGQISAVFSFVFFLLLYKKLRAGDEGCKTTFTVGLQYMPCHCARKTNKKKNCLGVYMTNFLFFFLW